MILLKIDNQNEEIMNRFKIIILLAFVCIATIFTGCESDESSTDSVNKYYLLTQLGNDTLAIEKIVESKDSIIAKVVLRSPKVRISSYHFYPNIEEGEFFKGVVKDAVSEEVLFTQVATRIGDSINVSLNDGERERNLAADQDGILSP